MENSLAVKCTHLYERLTQILEEKNDLENALFSMYWACEKNAEKFGFSERRKKILMETSKAHYKAMLDNARKAETIITEGSKNDGDGENQDGRGTQKT